MGGPWKAHGEDPRTWQRPAPRAEAVAMAGAHELAAVLAWMAVVVVGAAGLMLLAAW